jgi:hypothetical protein
MMGMMMVTNCCFDERALYCHQQAGLVVLTAAVL